LAHVGKEGVTEAALRSLRQAFATREIVKVRVLEAAPDGVRETAAALAAGVDASHVVQTVGRTVTLYRPDPRFPVIRLPKAE
ncbi:MAG TPA: YhbY family RNA-binding protein, partial [Rubricoccaceae bacterium]